MQVCTLYRCFGISAHICDTITVMCAHALVYAQFNQCLFALGDEGRCIGWGLFLPEGKTGRNIVLCLLYF